MKSILPLAAMLVLSLFLTGCLTPVENEIPLATGDATAAPPGTNDTRLVIFNDSNFLLYGLDGSGRINVKLNDRGVGQIRIGQYAQVIIPKGTYVVDLTHRDTADFRSQHQIELVDPKSFLEIHATMVAHEARLVPALPEDFNQKYKALSSP